MVWFFAAVVLALAVYSRPFRKVVAVVVAIAAVGLMGFYGYQKVDERVAASRVNTTEVQIELPWFSAASYGAFDFTGRLRNNSAFQVTKVEVDVAMQDCEPLKADAKQDWFKQNAPTVDYDAIAKQSGGYLATDPNAGEPLLPDTSKCDVVGQTTTTFQPNAPPSQVRDINARLYFSPQPVLRRGIAHFAYDVKTIHAKKP